MRKLLIVLVCLLFAVSASAEEKARIGEVVVTASKMPEPIEETTSDVIVITGEEIRQMNAEFVPDILRKVPSLHIIQPGGVGKFASVNLRGGSTTHTLIMIDGIKMNSTTTGSFDFSGVSVSDIERIEIVGGPQSTIYGSEAMAGVINVITKKGEGKTKAEASVEGGSFGTYAPSVTVSGGDKKFDYRLSGSYYHTDGISAAKSGSERDGYNNGSVSGRVGFRPKDNFELELTGKHYYDRSELDDFDFFAGEAVDNPDAVQRGNHTFLSARGKLYIDTWEQILTVAGSSEILKFKDPAVFFNNARIETQMYRVDWQNNFYVSSAYVLTLGAELSTERGENVGNFRDKLDNSALYLNNRLSLLNESLTLNAGLRHDRHETFGGETTYRLGAVYSIKTAGLRFRTSYGTGFRAPKFNELSFPFYGNPDLDPETSKAWEAGVEKDLLGERLTLSLTYFDQKYEDLIESDPLTFTAVNVAEAEVKGIEAKASFRVTDNISVNAGYAYLDTEDKETGDQLHLRPKDKISASVVFAEGKLSLAAYYTYVGERVDTFVAEDLSSYNLVNLSGTYGVTKWLSVFARIDNLLDEDYEESATYGTPGMSVFGGIRLTYL